MAFTYFLLGLLCALAAGGVALALLYRHLKRTRWQQAPIQGYLDLIPDLSSEQRAKVQDIRRTFLPKVEGIRENLCRERAQLAHELFADPTNREAILPVAEKILQHQAELEHEVIEHIIEEKEILTPSQRSQFYAIIVDQFASGGLGVHDVRNRRK